MSLSNAWILPGQEISLCVGSLTSILDYLTHPKLGWPVSQDRVQGKECPNLVGRLSGPLKSVVMQALP